MGEDRAVDAEDVENVSGGFGHRDLGTDLGAGHEVLVDKSVEDKPSPHRVGDKEQRVAVDETLGYCVIGEVILMALYGDVGVGLSSHPPCEGEAGRTRPVFVSILWVPFSFQS